MIVYALEDLGNNLKGLNFKIEQLKQQTKLRATSSCVSHQCFKIVSTLTSLISSHYALKQNKTSTSVLFKFLASFVLWRTRIQSFSIWWFWLKYKDNQHLVITIISCQKLQNALSCLLQQNSLETTFAK